MSGRCGTVKGGYLHLVYRSGYLHLVYRNGQRTDRTTSAAPQKRELELIWKPPKAKLRGSSEEIGSDSMYRQVVVEWVRVWTTHVSLRMWVLASVFAGEVTLLTRHLSFGFQRLILWIRSNQASSLLISHVQMATEQWDLPLPTICNVGLLFVFLRWDLLCYLCWIQIPGLKILWPQPPDQLGLQLYQTVPGESLGFDYEEVILIILFNFR